MSAGRQAGRVHWYVLPALVVAVGLIWFKRSEAPATEVVHAAAPSPLPMLPPAAGFDDEAKRVRQDKQRLLKARLTEAQSRLDSYKASTRYPYESRPISEHQDQLKPFDPIVEDKPMRTQNSQPVAGQHLRTTQDRVFVGGQESVRLTVSLVDDANQVLPLRVTRAVAHEVQGASGSTGYPTVAIQFEDRGMHGDAQAGDGVLTAVLQPWTQGFATLSGTIRTEVYLQSDAGPGQTFFDIIYTPTIPATWSGGVTESLDNGSLHFYLKAQVREAGRYVVSARVYDANGKAFALLTFNDEVQAGSTAFKLTLFGKLVRDAQPPRPFTLRDVEGFLLYENTFPDRAMMARLSGVVHTTQSYALSSFSDAEWQSEERSRYLTEYTKDVNQAQAALSASQ
jgi:hypothetical protein